MSAPIFWHRLLCWIGLHLWHVVDEERCCERCGRCQYFSEDESGWSAGHWIDQAD